MTPTIAVTTPTGHVGSRLVRALIRAGVRPRVLARSPDRVDPNLSAHVDLVAVDQSDRNQMVAATVGADALYWVTPSPFGAPDPLAEYRRFADVVSAAVTTNGIARTVLQSSVGAELRHGAGEIDGLAATEEALDGTGASVLHLRCGYFFTNLELQLDALRSGTVPVLLPLDQPMPWVDPGDIAEVAALRLLNEGWSGSAVQAVHGPQDLSWAQACAIVSAAVGRTITAHRIPDDEMRQLLLASGMTAAAVEAIVGMSTGLRDGFVPEQARCVASTTPTTLGAWAYQVLRPLLARRSEPAVPATAPAATARRRPARPPTRL